MPEKTLTLDEAFPLALAHRQKGELRRAEAIYRQIIEAIPEHADALHLLGVAAHQSERHEEAVALIVKAAKIAADQAP